MITVNTGVKGYMILSPDDGDKYDFVFIDSEMLWEL